MFGSNIPHYEINLLYLVDMMHINIFYLEHEFSLKHNLFKNASIHKKSTHLDYSYLKYTLSKVFMW